jgi:hypothetical protein
MNHKMAGYAFGSNPPYGLKHNGLMLTSEQRERLEAWATSDQNL